MLSARQRFHREQPENVFYTCVDFQIRLAPAQQLIKPHKPRTSKTEIVPPGAEHIPGKLNGAVNEFGGGTCVQPLVRKAERAELRWRG